MYQHDLWARSDPDVPTYETGASTDAALLAAGNYIPDRPQPTASKNNIGGERDDSYPVCVTDDSVMGDHMALFATSFTIRPDIRTNFSKYKSHLPSKPQWAHRNELFHQVLPSANIDGTCVSHLGNLYPKPRGLPDIFPKAL